MYFDYALYKLYCYECPVYGGLFFAFAFVVCIVPSVFQVIKKKRSLRDISVYAFLALGYAFVVCTSIGQLSNGGIHLRDEREADALEIEGEITNIKGLGLFSFPVVKGDYKHDEKNGYEFTINGIQCKAVLKRSLKVGDYVTVKYLPKSGYILYIDEVNRNATDIE